MFSDSNEVGPTERYEDFNLTCPINHFLTWSVVLKSERVGKSQDVPSVLLLKSVKNVLKNPRNATVLHKLRRYEETYTAGVPCGREVPVELTGAGDGTGAWVVF